jgi:hypothetical protein
MFMGITNLRFDYVWEDMDTSWSEVIIDFVHSKEKLLTNPLFISGDSLDREAVEAANSSQIDSRYFKRFHYGRIFILIMLKDSLSKSCQFMVKH